MNGHFGRCLSEIFERLGRAARRALTGSEEVAALFRHLQKRVAPRINISSLVHCVRNEQGLFLHKKSRGCGEIKAGFPGPRAGKQPDGQRFEAVFAAAPGDIGFHLL